MSDYQREILSDCAAIGALHALPGHIRTAEEAALAAAISVRDAQRQLESVSADLLQQGPDGPVNGKNAETRNAQLKDLTVLERQAVDAAADVLERTKIEVRFLQNDFSAVRAIARLMAGAGE